MSDKNLSFDRRSFLKAATGATLLPAWFIEENLARADTPQPKSPNDKPNIGLIGCGGMGRGDAKNAARFGKVVAVCDVDEKHAGEASKEHGDAKIYDDFRKLLENKDIHAVINATPDHWHTLVNLAALKAGKDVYSEKPLTLTIDEGKRLVKAVQESGRILQTGSQQRSDAKFRLACELVRNGRLGKLTEITTILPAGLREGPFNSAPVPKELNWDFWQGQAPQHEYVEKRTHLFFRYWLDYSGGTMTDWGAHHNDIALWAMGLDRSGPLTIEGKPPPKPIDGGYTAPSEYEVEYTYANGVRQRCISTTVNTIFGGQARPPKQGELPHSVRFEGPEGWIYVTRGKLEASQPELIKEPLKSKKVELYVSNDHMGNFFDCIRTRKAPICEAEIGHRSVSVCHLGVIATRLGRKLKWDPEKEQFVDDQDANGFLAREMRKPWNYDMI
jgi:myo-inositol 2-dehydrogenase / D-chiro-inositol 1-dehydrogenase